MTVDQLLVLRSFLASSFAFLGGLLFLLRRALLLLVIGLLVRGGHVEDALLGLLVLHIVDQLRELVLVLADQLPGSFGVRLLAIDSQSVLFVQIVPVLVAVRIAADRH